MRGQGAAGLLLPAAIVAVFAADVAWPVLRRLARTVARWPPLARLQIRAGRLPVPLALPLFLVPELCSRLGWVVSVWLALHGQPWRGLAVYVATKLIAGSLALWIYAACLPVLLRVRWFAAAHAALLMARRSAGRWVPGPIAAANADRRAARVRRRSSAAAQASATPSALAGPSPTE